MHNKRILTVRGDEELKALTLQAANPDDLRARSFLVGLTRDTEEQAKLLDHFGFDFTNPNYDSFGAPQL